jgi:cytochrome c biogenesis protein
MIKNLRNLADLRFAISLLLLIAIIITIGSVIEQNQQIEFYKENYPLERPIFGFISWKFIQFFQLQNIYQNFWFLGILSLFGVSLISCTFLQQFPILRFSRRCHFYKKKKIDFEIKINSKNIGNFLNKILKQGYFVFQQKKMVYASKGLIGRIAPVFVHLSIILILFGSIIASFSSFNAQELTIKSEVFHIQNTIGFGSFSRFSQQPIRVNDFWINYYLNDKIKQFYSNISILDHNGKEIINKTISVNKPLIYKNLTFYQTDWSIIGLRINNEQKCFQLPTISTKKFGNKVWVTFLPTKNQKNEEFNGKTLVINNYKGNISIYDLNGNLLKNIDKNEFILDKKYKLIDFLSLTGLQIKSDFGLQYIYAGFGFLMISTLLSYFSFSEVWLINNDIKERKKTYLSVFGKTNRTKVYLTVELSKITKFLN